MTCLIGFDPHMPISDLVGSPFSCQIIGVSQEFIGFNVIIAVNISDSQAPYGVWPTTTSILDRFRTEKSLNPLTCWPLWF